MTRRPGHASRRDELVRPCRPRDASTGDDVVRITKQLEGAYNLSPGRKVAGEAEWRGCDPEGRRHRMPPAPPSGLAPVEPGCAADVA